MAEDTFTCERCGRDRPARQMKEVMHEEGRSRITRRVCPECLDAIMNESPKVRGIAGDEKRAAIHVNRTGSGGERQTFGDRP